jgi:acetylornithine deacetylase
VSLGPREGAVADAVDAGQVARDLASLVAIPSVDGTPAEAEAQRWCVAQLRRLGLAVDEWEIDVAALRQHPEFPGMEVDRGMAVGCVGVMGADTAAPGSYAVPGLALYGHTDVVPPGDAASWGGLDPFRLRVEGDLAHGRGSCDMKAGVVATLAAARALRTLGVELARPLALHLVSAEEDGGVGAVSTLARGHTADAVVIAEPTSGTIVPANGGALTFRLEVPGLATHGSTRTHGVSAVTAFETVHGALRDLEARRNAHAPALFAHLDLAWPLSVGVVRAGAWASTVPDSLVAEGRYGVAIGETVGQARAEFEAAVAVACAADAWLRDHPVRVTWPGGRFASAALPEDSPLIGQVASAVSRVRDTSPPVLGAPYGSDLRHYQAHGIPAVQYGPGDVRYAHAGDEHVSLADTVACAQVYAVLALALCG